MILTFELDKYGGLHVFFDHEGRDRLMELLSMCDEPGDHQHMWVMPDNVIEMTPGKFFKDSKAVTEVTLGMPGPGLTLILDEDEKE
jgi:hypothetical protein